MATFDERLTVNFTLIDFVNSQKTEKSKIIFTFQEVEQKPFILTFEAPNPYYSRLEMIDELKRKMAFLTNEINEKKIYDVEAVQTKNEAIRQTKIDDVEND